MELVTRAARTSALSLGCTLVAAAGACAGSSGAPSTLSDGTRAGEAPVPFEGIDAPVISSTARVIPIRQGSRTPPSIRTCLRSSTASPGSLAVLRSGVDGTTVTFRARSGRSLFACDGAGARPGPWCGIAFGRLHGGRLDDPRLDLAACPAPDGPNVAFVWVEPGRGARWVAVGHDGFAEAYATAGGLPVRVATRSGVDTARSAATVALSEHDRRGRLLRRYELRARVAG
jgi:hypothetical protein